MPTPKYSALHYAAKAEKSAASALSSKEHCDQVVTTFDTHAADKTIEFDNHVSDKTDAFDIHADGKIKEASDWAIRSEEASHVTLRDVTPLGTLSPSSTVSLKENEVYSATISGDGIYTFQPSFIIAGQVPTYHVQIKLFLTVSVSSPTISWGVSKFINGTEPDIEVGNFIIYWDYDNQTQEWCCGGLPYTPAT